MYMYIHTYIYTYIHIYHGCYLKLNLGGKFHTEVATHLP